MIWTVADRDAAGVIESDLVVRDHPAWPFGAEIDAGVGAVGVQFSITRFAIVTPVTVTPVPYNACGVTLVSTARPLGSLPM